jgi:DNA-binding NarL/FixJ family response regulator
MSNYDASLAARKFHRPGVDASESGALFKEGASTTIALIDGLLFSRDCVIQALRALHPEMLLVPFASVDDCLSSSPITLNLILYYAHGDGPCETLVAQHVKQLRQAFSGVPVIILSDARAVLQPRQIRSALNSGARGFIPTSITEMSAAVAAIRFVRDGGTFAPLDVLLTRPAPVAVAGARGARHLTPRQRTVLLHLRQGKANKIIAYELGMTESTVKVHIRNIMRKLGASNRTQAVYNSQQLSDTSADTSDDAGLND